MIVKRCLAPAVVVIALWLLQGCAQPMNPEPQDTGPSASFTADVTTGPAPTLVQFTDLSAAGSAAITAWFWDFGDGFESTQQNPIHDYGEPGTYTVSLSVTTSVGTDLAVRNEYIEIEAVPPVMPAVRAPAAAVTGSTVELQGTTSPGADLLVTEGVQNVSATADGDGAFRVDVPINPNRVTKLFVTASLDGLDSAPVPVEVVQDSQAPTVFIDFPADGAQLTQDTVTVAGGLATRSAASIISRSR